MDALPTSIKLERPLGGIERMFWLKNRHMPYHFAVCAEILGEASLAAWIKAVGAVQQRHPAFSVAIVEDENGIPWFRQTAGSDRCSLRIVAQEDARWEVEMERELALPFDDGRVPLVRVVLVTQSYRTFLILAAHHSIADTKSLVFALRDMVQSVAGHSLDPMLPAGSLDSLLQPFETQVAKDGVAFPSPGSLDLYRTIDGSPPHVSTANLSEALTSELRRRARKEGTTVHGALVAAAVEAARLTSPELAVSPITVGSAVDARDAVSGGESVALLSAGGSILIAPEMRDFWKLARHARDCILPLKSPDVMASLMGGLNGFLSTPRTVNDIAAFMAGFRFDINISNLGNLPIETRFGGLTVERLWGPAILAGFAGEQEIGVSTVNGSLSLLHVSHDPLPSFLRVVRDRLVMACASESALAAR